MRHRGDWKSTGDFHSLAEMCVRCHIFKPRPPRERAREACLVHAGVVIVVVRVDGGGAPQPHPPPHALHPHPPTHYDLTTDAKLSQNQEPACSGARVRR